MMSWYYDSYDYLIITYCFTQAYLEERSEVMEVPIPCCPITCRLSTLYSSRAAILVKWYKQYYDN